MKYVILLQSLLLFNTCFSQGTNNSISKFTSFTDSTFSVGQIFKDFNIYFYPGYYDLLESQHIKLDSVVKFLMNNDSIIIGIKVFDSCDFSNIVTPMRAKRICDYLNSKGIESNRIVCEGKGEYTGDDPYFIKFPIVVFYIYKIVPPSQY